MITKIISVDSNQLRGEGNTIIDINGLYENFDFKKP